MSAFQSTTEQGRVGAPSLADLRFESGVLGSYLDQEISRQQGLAASPNVKDRLEAAHSLSLLLLNPHSSVPQNVQVTTLMQRLESDPDEGVREAATRARQAAERIGELRTRGGET